jgi:hypothetical protein
LIQHVWQMDRQTTVHNYEISPMWDTNLQTSQKVSWLLLGTEQVMKPTTLQAI